MVLLIGEKNRSRAAKSRRFQVTITKNVGPIVPHKRRVYGGAQAGKVPDKASLSPICCRETTRFAKK
jgi:hypothetical protein